MAGYAGEPDGVHLYQSGRNTKLNDLPLVTVICKDARGNLWFKNVHGETATVGDYKAPADTSQSISSLLTPLNNIKSRIQYQHDDRLWIGGDEILAIVDRSRKDLIRLTDSRHVRFCSMVMGNDSVLWGGYGDCPQKLHRLDSDERHLHFFYALDYAPLTGETLYRYRLVNKSILVASGQWSEWTDKQDVEFLNLPYGSFTLSVQAQLANGELSEVATVDFSIAYPLPMRWYMVLLYLLIFAYIIYLLFRYRLKRLEKEKVKLERIVEERTADLRNAQHELVRQEKMATVGKLTKGLVDRILLDMLTKNLTSVHQFGQNTTRILKAMEEVLRDRTGGYGDITLQPALQQVEKQFAKHHAQEQEQNGIRPVFDLPDDPMPLYGNPDMLCKAIMNLLDNAVYAVMKKVQNEPSFTPEVSLTVTVADAHYILKIRDNGTGIEAKNLNKIYDPFFTTKTTGEAAGVGLYLTREIIQNHGGDISVASVQGEYTAFTITLPKVKK